MTPPIKVRAHSLIDYGFFACAAGGPVLLGLRGRARAIPLAFAATQGALNALTDQPYAVRRLVPFALHGRSESVAVPGLAAGILLAGAHRQPRAAPFFAALVGSLVIVYRLTDWDATPPR